MTPKKPLTLVKEKTVEELIEFIQHGNFYDLYHPPIYQFVSAHENTAVLKMLLERVNNDRIEAEMNLGSYLDDGYVNPSLQDAINEIYDSCLAEGVRFEDRFSQSDYQNAQTIIDHRRV